MRLVLTILLIFSCTMAHSQEHLSDLHEEWLVQFKQQVNTSKQNAQYSVKRISEFQNIYLLRFYAPVNKNTLLNTIKGLPSPVHVYPNIEIEQRSIIPNDPLFGEQWNLEMINLPQLWEETQGGLAPSGEEIVIAVLDDGIDINHEDLQSNIWVNQGEIPDDRLDNDGNGYVDDYQWCEYPGWL